MPFDVNRFCRDYRVDSTTKHNHCSSGWTNVHCPMCKGSDNFHLGINPETGQCHCWRCGGHSLRNTLKAILGDTSWGQINAILDEYTVGKIASTEPKEKRSRTISPNSKELVLPYGSGELLPIHKRYLKRVRGFDPIKLEKTYGLKGTCEFGPYKYRIIAPIYDKGQLVSYQGRDITGKSELRYKACSTRFEKIHHKFLLYGEWLMDSHYNQNIVVVEGITDQWRLGIGSVGVFGIEWTLAQALRLCKYKKVIVLFDEGVQAQIQAEKLCNLVALNGVEAERVTLNLLKGKDPADLGDEEAHEVMNYLLNI